LIPISLLLSAKEVVVRKRRAEAIASLITVIGRSPEIVAYFFEKDGNDVHDAKRRDLGLSPMGWGSSGRVAPLIWLEDWDFFLRVALRYPDRTRWVPKILIDYRQVHGEGADGICAKAREGGAAEVAGRRYLLDKWGSHPEFDARDKLDVTLADLLKLRAPDGT
jgi:hypothetical protein